MTILEQKRNLNRNIKKSRVVFLMAHKDLDLDALGSCIGMYNILKNLNKECYIIIDDEQNEQGVQMVLDKIVGQINIIQGREIEKYTAKKSKKNLLIVLDTNKTHLVQDETALTKITNIIIIDHHQQNEQSMTHGLSIIDNTASSTCEMITELVEYYHVEIDSEAATLLLAGIVLDTNNFVIKTGEKTYYTAYYLTKIGADPKKVQYLLKQDIKDYIERQKVITEVEIIDNHIALTKGRKHVSYRREDLAKIADTLLVFNDMEASFVLGQLDKNTIGISARSMGKIKVNTILEAFGGGGDNHEAAAKVEGKRMDAVEKALIREIQLHCKEEK